MSSEKIIQCYPEITKPNQVQYSLELSVQEEYLGCNRGLLIPNLFGENSFFFNMGIHIAKVKEALISLAEQLHL